MKTVDAFKKARAMIQRGWCKKSAAVDSLGHMVDERSSKACAWCIGGALSASSGGMQGVFAAFRRHNNIDSIIGFNDDPSRIHSEVIAAFDRAIAAEEAKQRSP